jgi:putative CocE/NonD family hydrolase
VEASYDGVVASTFYIRSADGTRLAISLHRPTRGGVLEQAPLPVILQQSRGISNDPEDVARRRFFTDRGYIWMTQSRRGSGASFGSETGFITRYDALDAKSAIEWAGVQPFSNGRVVAYGCSNEGLWQYAVLALQPRHLVAISPQCATAMFFDQGISRGGIQLLPLAAAPYDGSCAPAQAGLASRSETARAPVDQDADGVLLRAAQVEQQCAAPFLGQYWLNMPRDGYNSFAGNRPGIADAPITFWREIRESAVPVLEIGGWFDTGVAGQFETQRLWGGRAVMLPRVHGNRVMGDRFPGDTFDINGEVLRWFDHYAKDIQNGANWPGVTYYTINAPAGREWHYAPTWRAASAPLRPFHLLAQGLREEAAPAAGRAVVYPQVDVAWFDGTYAPLARTWDGDMAHADALSIVHDTMPLAQAMEMTGTPTARLWVSADQRDVNVFVAVEDVAPDGRSTYVTDGRLRASWRKPGSPPWEGSDWNWHRGHAEDIVPLTPGEPVELVFDLHPISYVFAAGHQIRLGLITATGNAFEAPPLAGGEPVTLTLYRDTLRPSRIDLPLRELQP